MSFATLLLIHAAATWFMTGLIWFVQVVHYPLLHRVPEGAAATYAREHQRLTAWVVGPPMLLEAATAVLLLWPPFRPAGAFPWLLAGLALLGLIWASTAFVQVPLHRRLAAGSDAAAVARLVRTNRLRAAAWSARSLLLLFILIREV